MIYQVELFLFLITGKKVSPQTFFLFHTDTLYVESLRFFAFHPTLPMCIYCVGLVSGMFCKCCVVV